jgi:hypothetical protein
MINFIKRIKENCEDRRVQERKAYYLSFTIYQQLILHTFIINIINGGKKREIL